MQAKAAAQDWREMFITVHDMVKDPYKPAKKASHCGGTGSLQPVHREADMGVAYGDAVTHDLTHVHTPYGGHA